MGSDGPSTPSPSSIPSPPAFDPLATRSTRPTTHPPAPTLSRLLPALLGARRVSPAVAQGFTSTLHLARSLRTLPPSIVALLDKKTTPIPPPKKTPLGGMNNPAWTVRTLSVPGDDTDLTLWVSFDNARFCFGAGEGAQRAFIQKRLKMGGMQAIFLPDGVNARGGLPGMIMTAADAGNREISVVGPPDTNRYMASLRGSVTRDAFAVNGVAFPRSSTAPSELLYDNPRIAVHAVALRPEDPAVALESAVGSRPTTLAPTEVDKYAAAMVQDMFGRASGLPRPKLNPPRLFDGMNRYGSCDDRYPLPVASDADVATDMVYICRTPETRGKFNNALAKELNIPNGPIRAELTQGKTIEFDDPTAPGGRRTVTPEQCLVGGGPGSILVVVNCREHNLERLLASTAFSEHQSAKPKSPVHSMVHRVDRAVWEDPRYQAWIQSFGGTEHLYADAISSHEIFFAGSAWNALKLSMLNSEMFTVPFNAVTTPPAPTLAANASILQVNQLQRMHPPKPAELMPNHPKDIPFPTTVEGLDAAREGITRNPQFAEFIAAVKAAKESVAAAEAKRTVTTAPGDDIVITTLGTGSAIPSKYRNVSATYIDVPDVGAILLDCGEGTLGQMRRRFGPEGMKKVYADLKLINVSHMHADHHLGLCSILADRFKHGVTEPLYLVAPWAIALQLEETAWWQAGASREALENVRWINCNRLKFPWFPRSSSPDAAPVEDAFTPEDAKTNPGAWCDLTTTEDVAAGKRKWPFKNMFRISAGANNRFHEHLFALMKDLGLKMVHAPLVSHRGIAYGLVLEHQSGWKIAYSGDTKPCDAFVEAAKGATILIHEATIEDDKPDVAEKKGHSTFGQAIDVGTRMGAKYIILNHFSQRYPKAPTLQLSETGPTVSISFDFMSLRAADTWKMAHYMDAINVLFAEEEDEDAEAVLEKHTHRQKGPRSDAEKAKHQEKARAKDARKAQKSERRDAALKVGVKRDSSASDDEGAPAKAAKKARAEVSHVQDKVSEMVVDERAEAEQEAVAAADEAAPVAAAPGEEKTASTHAGWRMAAPST